MISLSTIKAINQILDSLNPEDVKDTDRTLTGFIIYDFLLATLSFYEVYVRIHYGASVLFKKTHISNEIKPETAKLKIENFKNSQEVIWEDQDFNSRLPQKTLDVDNLLLEVSRILGPGSESPSFLKSKSDARLFSSHRHISNRN